MSTQPIFVRWTPKNKEDQRAILYSIFQVNGEHRAIIINPLNRAFVEVPLTSIVFDKWDY